MSYSFFWWSLSFVMCNFKMNPMGLNCLSEILWPAYSPDVCALISLQIIPMWWFNWLIYLCLLSVLLLCPLRYVWIHADLIFLWIHGLHMLWFLLNAWNCWIPSSVVLCSSHIPIHQVRVGILSFQELLLSSFHRHSVENYSNFAVFLCTISETGLGRFPEQLVRSQRVLFGG